MREPDDVRMAAEEEMNAAFLAAVGKVFVERSRYAAEVVDVLEPPSVVVWGPGHILTVAGSYSIDVYPDAPHWVEKELTGRLSDSLSDHFKKAAAGVFGAGSTAEAKVDSINSGRVTVTLRSPKSEQTITGHVEESEGATHRMRAVIRGLRRIVGEETVASMTAPYAKPFMVDPRQVRPAYDPAVDEKYRKKKKKFRPGSEGKNS